MRAARLILAAVLFVSLTAAQAPESRTARLTRAPVDEVTFTEFTGSGLATARLDGSVLRITGTFEGLGAPATTANLHAGAKGIRGPVVAPLELDSGTEGTIRAELTLSDVQADYFRNERLYIQLQSNDYPDGLLRGWLVQPED